MKTKFLMGLLAAPLLFASVSMPAMAKKTAEPVTCVDGTTSAAKGRGACSGHGGVKKDDAGAAPAAAAAAPAAAPAAAAGSGGSVCKDGSTSEKTGRGACSGHGGVAKGSAKPNTAAAPAAPAAAPAPAAAAAPVAAAPVAAAPAVAATRSASTGSASSKDPTGATAKCKDGAYSHSTNHTGACSHHGGVDQWLKQ